MIAPSGNENDEKEFFGKYDKNESSIAEGKASAGEQMMCEAHQT